MWQEVEGFFVNQENVVFQTLFLPHAGDMIGSLVPERRLFTLNCNLSSAPLCQSDNSQFKFHC